MEKKQELIQSGSRYVSGLSEKQKSGGSETQSDEQQGGLSSAEKRKLQKEREAQQRRLQRRKEQLEKNIGNFEADIRQLENKVSDPEIMRDHEKLAEISCEIVKKREQLESDYEEWIELQEQE